MSTVKFDTWQNTDGTENYKCRAWVNFNGTGTVAIRASGNVSSITDNGTGNYTVNFTTAMVDTSYSTALTISDDNVTASQTYESGVNNSNRTTNSFKLYTTDYAGSPDDRTLVCASVFR